MSNYIILKKLKQDAERVSRQNPDIKYYVVWNKYGEWGWIDKSPVESDENGTEIICSYLDGVEDEY